MATPTRGSETAPASVHASNALFAPCGVPRFPAELMTLVLAHVAALAELPAPALYFDADEPPEAYEGRNDAIMSAVAAVQPYACIVRRSDQDAFWWDLLVIFRLPFATTVTTSCSKGSRLVPSPKLQFVWWMSDTSLRFATPAVVHAWATQLQSVAQLSAAARAEMQARLGWCLRVYRPEPWDLEDDPPSLLWPSTPAVIDATWATQNGSKL